MVTYPDPVIPFLGQIAKEVANKGEEEILTILYEYFCKDCPFPRSDPGDGIFPLPMLDGGDLPFPLRYVMEGSSAPAWEFRSELVSSGDNQAFSTKILGTGVYRAIQIGTTITITASGQLPNENTGVRLEQLAFLVYPPMFGLFFYEPKLKNDSDQNFPATASMNVGSEISIITVHDADGFHRIEVEKL